MKKVLIVSYLFAPENMIGAVRPTKLSKYLAHEGNIVEVITCSYKVRVDNALLKDIQNAVEVIELDHSKIVDKYNCYKSNSISKNNINTQPGKEIKKKFRITSTIRHLLFRLKHIIFSYDFYYSFIKHVKKNKIKYSEFDVIVTTFGPLASVLCGFYFKKRYPNCRWVCDFRDPMVVDLFPSLINRYNLIIQERACKVADRIVAVSHGYLKRICKDRYGLKSYVIPNGYDISDLSYECTFKMSDKFTFVYTGVLYNGKRDIGPIFKVFHDLIKEKIIDKNDLLFNYAGSDFPILYHQAQKYGLEGIIVDYGFVFRKESIKLQEQSRYLVLATWNSNEEIGVFPGKLLEYMSINKPIISIVNGNLPNSEVTEVMHAAKLGISYEVVRHDTDYALLKEYIKNEYTRFKAGLDPEYCPNREVIGSYNYKNIAKQFEELF